MSVRIGIVGYGDIAQYHLRHLAAAGAEIGGVVTKRPTPAHLKRYPSMGAMLPEVDAVTIAVPNALHASMCLEAIAAKMPVFVEKPLCINDGELHELAPAAISAAAPVHVGFRLRWNPFLRALRERVHRVRRVRCVYRLGIDRLAAGKSWTRREAESGGAFCTLGVHALDVARWLAGAAARPLAGLRAAGGHREAGADFPLFVRLEGMLSDGTRIEAGADLRDACDFGLELELDAIQSSTTDPSLPRPRPEEPSAADVEYGAMMKDFVDAVRWGRTRPDDIAEILQCHRELLAARSLV